MCGIFGHFTSNKLTRRKDHRIQLTAAQHALRHRGPNDRGLATFSIDQGRELPPGELNLGHTRLSILDLSPRGHQPMTSPDGRFTIVFNGEIYNYRELRQELRSVGHAFTTDTDTEVLLMTWAQSGVDGLKRLTGMFSFTVYDRTDESITLVRDPFGIKPLFYSNYGECFAFASEINALENLLPTKPQLSWQSAYDYLVHGVYDKSPSSMLKGVMQLAPGSYIKLGLAPLRPAGQVRWWTPATDQRKDLSFSHATELVRELFLKNIQLHLRSDVPVGAALSGGVDSSAVVCAMRHLDPQSPIHTFSFISRETKINEEAWVDRVNTHVGAISHKVHVSSQEIANDLDDIIKSQGEPFASTSIYAQYRVFKLAKEKGIRVTLDGQGADEMLAGYQGYPGQRLRSLVETGQLTKAWDFLNQWSHWPGRSKWAAVKGLLGQQTRGTLYHILRRLNGDVLCPKWLNNKVLSDSGVHITFPAQTPEIPLKGRRVVAELAASLYRRGLSSLLRHGDRNSMRFSIESRVPFLTTELADLLLSFPEEYLISPSGETKRVFRAAMRGIVPNDILDRKDKIGFATPESDWLIPMAPVLRKWLCSPIDVPFLNQSALLRQFDEVIQGSKPLTPQFWRWVNFWRWYQLTRMS